MALLRRRGLSENTIRRRITARRELYDAMIADGLIAINPAGGRRVAATTRRDITRNSPTGMRTVGFSGAW